MSEAARQIVAIVAFIFFGPLLMITSLNYADALRYELNEVKEEEESD